MLWLRRHVGKCGFICHQFHYPTVRNTLASNALLLSQFVDAIDAETLHFVGHSLGGLVIRQLFCDFPGQRPGRVVTLGTPHQGSEYARHLSRFAFWRWALGASIDGGLLGERLPAWRGTHDFGVIAGGRNVGTGLLLPALREQGGDGVVGLAESHLAGETDYTVVRAVHTQLLVSSRVHQQICRFLKSGHFLI
ncbi:MAG: hypothetical protein BMS9Abin26_1075 [Gammaproteobacteria bacterium]|nr:MAG: hypothetical protein BMS9Abin26_1075 [Gammaproteobacteria bacterium]